jgi:hypothetical protein
MLLADGGAITGWVFCLLGIIFVAVGLPLAFTLREVPVGLPFAGLGLLFALVGIPLLAWRFGRARQRLALLRQGTAIVGEIMQVRQNLYVRVNRRHPWNIHYRFLVQGRAYQGKVTTLNTQAANYRTGQGVNVIYAPGEPERNTLYPIAW